MNSYDLLQAVIVGLVTGIGIGCWAGYFMGYRTGAIEAAEQMQDALDAQGENWPVLP